MKRINNRFFYIFIGFLTLVNVVLGITQRSLNGDEYNSIKEMINLGLNWNGIGYYVIMHFWVKLGDGEIWLRLPSIFFGFSSVIFIYLAVNKANGSKSALYSMVIAGTSPFLASCSQQVRFYSFFLFATALSIYASVTLVDRPNKKSWIIWGISCLVLPLSHFLGVLFMFASFIAVYTALKVNRKAAVFGGGGIALLFLIPLIPGIIELAWKIYTTIAASPGSTQVHTTPVTWINFVKLGFAGFTYFFGYNTYPLDLWFVVPGILLLALAIFFGIANTFVQKTPLIWQNILVYSVILLLGVYVVLDSVGGRVAGGVSPRHAAFMWPVLMILIGFGFRSPSVIGKIVLPGLLLVNIFGNYERLTAEWSYETDINYRQAYETLRREMAADTWVVYDGRSYGSILYYLQREPGEKFIYKSIDEITIIPENVSYLPSQILVVSSDHRSQVYEQTNKKILEISKAYSLKRLWNDYPFFALLYEKAEWVETGIRQSDDHIELPFQIFGSEFQDISLPLEARGIGETISLGTSYSLGPGEKIKFTLDGKQSYQSLNILSNLIPSPKLKKGDTVMIVTLEEKSPITHRLHFGDEIESWSRNCQPTETCQTIYSWRKRIALQGHSAYPGSWNDFLAAIHSVSIPLNNSYDTQYIFIQNTTSDTVIYLWGISLNDMGHKN